MEIIGIIISSLLGAWTINYLADVLPVSRSFIHPVCVHCFQPVGWGRFIGLRPCPHCGKQNTLRKILVLIAFQLVVIIIWLEPPSEINFYLCYILAFYFFVVAVIDIEHHVVLYQVTLAGALLGLVVGFLRQGSLATLLGALTGLAVMLLLYYFGILFVKLMSKTRNQSGESAALGFGDVTLGGVLGLMVGWPEIIGTILIAVMLAGLFSLGVISISLVRRKYQAYASIPYAPFLLLGAGLFLFIS